MTRRIMIRTDELPSTDISAKRYSKKRNVNFSTEADHDEGISQFMPHIQN